MRVNQMFEKKLFYLHNEFIWSELKSILTKHINQLYLTDKIKDIFLETDVGTLKFEDIEI